MKGKDNLLPNALSRPTSESRKKPTCGSFLFFGGEGYYVVLLFCNYYCRFFHFSISYSISAFTLAFITRLARLAAERGCLFMACRKSFVSVFLLVVGLLLCKPHPPPLFSDLYLLLTLATPPCTYFTQSAFCKFFVTSTILSSTNYLVLRQQLKLLPQPFPLPHI